jgi:hypothetical protein
MQSVDLVQTESPVQTTPSPAASPNVEPGMRLRPIGSTGQERQTTRMQQLQQQQQQRTTIPAQSSSRQPAPSMMPAPNQANTIYMIMVPQEQAGANQTTTATGVPRAKTTSQAPSMLLKFQTGGQQQQQQQQQQGVKTAPSQSGTMTSSTQATGGFRMVSPSRQPFERLTTATGQSMVAGPQTTSTTQSMQVPMSTRKSTSGQQLVQTTGREPDAGQQTTSRPRFVSQDEFNEWTRQKPMTTVTTARTTTSAPQTTTMSIRTRPDESVTTTSTSAGPDELATTTKAPSTSATSGTTSSSRSNEQTPTATTRPTPAATTAGSPTTGARTTMPARVQLDVTPSTTGGGGRREESVTASQQLGQRPQDAATETGAAGSPQRPTSATSGQQKQIMGKTSASGKGAQSFIPSKLRSDFNSKRLQAQQQQQQQQQQLSNEITPSGSQREGNVAGAAKLTEMSSASAASRQTAPLELQQQAAANSSQSAQSMSAIRQFGGANRMSALKNAPVPFGRPATMMMAPPAGGAAKSAKLLAGGRQQQPSVEYGPAIAVRRPDEPLANGQMPNCTLTGKNFCVITKDYPMNEVRQAVERSFRSVRLMYEELQTVSDQDLNRHESEQASGTDNNNGNNTQLLTSGHGKFACQTKVEMLRPGWARDEISKEWLVVVNTDVFPQRVRTESCAQPMAPCDFVAPFYDSHCQQRYSLHRFIAVDPQQPSRVTTVLMRFKAGCNCFLKRKV